MFTIGTTITVDDIALLSEYEATVIGHCLHNGLYHLLLSRDGRCALGVVSFRTNKNDDQSLSAHVYAQYGWHDTFQQLQARCHTPTTITIL